MSASESEVVSTPRVRRARSYSHQQRAQALALYDQTGALERTAQTLGIPLSTLAGWVNNPDNFSELRSKNQLDLAAKFENAAHLFLDLAVKKSKKANFNHLMTGAGIAVDKSQLLKGLPTSISGSIQSDEERNTAKAQLFAAIEARAIEGEIAGQDKASDGELVAGCPRFMGETVKQ